MARTWLILALAGLPMVRAAVVSSFYNVSFAPTSSISLDTSFYTVKATSGNATYTVFPGDLPHILNEQVRISCVSLDQEKQSIYETQQNSTTATDTATFTGDCEECNEGPLPTSFDTASSAVHTATYALTMKSEYSNSLPPECCGTCQLEASAIEIRYWPTPAPDPPVTETVDSTGFTYVSPSVYIVFSGLFAVAQCGTLGTSIDSTTLSFGPTELYTYLNSEWSITPYGKQTLNYVQLASECPPTTSATAAISQTGNFSIDLSSNPCQPYVSVPPQIPALQSMWANCSGAIEGFYDPPFALVKQVADAITAPADPTVTAAAPAATPNPQNTPTSIWNPGAAPTGVVPGPVDPSQTPDDPGIPSSGNPPAIPVDPGTGVPVDPNNPPAVDPTLTSPVPPNNAPIPYDPGVVGSPAHPPAAIDPGIPATSAANPIPSQVVVGGSTVSEGGDPISVGGTTVQISSGNLIVGSVTTPVAALAAPTPVQQGGSPPQQPGAPQQNPPAPVYTPTVVNGLSISPIAPPPSASALSVETPLIIGGATASVDPAGSAVVIGSQTVEPNAPAITVGGTPVSLGPGGLVLAGTSTVPLPGQGSGTGAGAITTGPFQVFTVAGQTFTPGSAGFSIAGTTLSPGGAGVTLSGTPVSLGPNGNLLIGSSTVATLPQQSVYTVAGQVFTPEPQGFSIAGTSISAGGPGIFISGTPISLDPDGDLVIGTRTIATLSSQSIFTVAGQIFTANPSAFSIDGTTISEGGPGVTIDGMPVSLGPGGDLDIGTSTAHLNTEAAAATGLGGAILSAFGGPVGTAANGAGGGGGVPFQGSAAGGRRGKADGGVRWKVIVVGGGLGFGLITDWL
ncbi:hypothetical protein MMC09_000118 [Bachmanniomyces sp. S44760]|nr:hypothetical protein [Bachmanniomyces sp. S44760]